MRGAEIAHNFTQRKGWLRLRTTNLQQQQKRTFPEFWRRHQKYLVTTNTAFWKGSLFLNIEQNLQSLTALSWFSTTVRTIIFWLVSTGPNSTHRWTWSGRNDEHKHGRTLGTAGSRSFYTEVGRPKRECPIYERNYTAANSINTILKFSNC